MHIHSHFPAKRHAPTRGRVQAASGSCSPQRFDVSVVVDEHTGGRGLRTDKGACVRVDVVREKAFATAQQERVNRQHHLGYRAARKQRGRQTRDEGSPERVVGRTYLLAAAKAFWSHSLLKRMQ